MCLFVYLKVGTLTSFVCDAQCSARHGNSTRYLLVECCDDPDKVQGGKRGWVMLLKSQPDLLLFQLLWIQKRFCPLLIPCMNSSWASWWLSDKESACQCRRCRFDPWIRKIPWIRKWQPTPVFLSGKSHGQNMSLVGYRPWVWIELDMTEWLSTHRSSQSVGSQRARHDLATEHRMKGTFHLIKRKSYNFKTMQVKRGMWSV